MGWQMIAVMFAVLLAIQAVPSQASPPAADEAQQAAGQAALDGMVRIFTAMGSCERHFTPEQVRGVKRAFTPEPGQQPSALEAYIAAAYERGKADTALSAPACQEIMRVLAQSKARSGQ